MRAGKVTISREFAFSDEMRQLRVAFFSVFHPYCIENTGSPNNLLYYGTSERFEEVEEGKPIPKYDVYFSGQDENISLEIYRVKTFEEKVESKFRAKYGKNPKYK